MTKNKVRGIAKAEQLHKKRSKDAKKADLSKRAKKTVRPNKKGIQEWNKNPGQTDIFAVDTPNRCQRCGIVINSRWKKYCFKCLHEMKGDYDSNKLQKRFGGTK